MAEIEPVRPQLIVSRPRERAPVAYSDLDYSVTVDTARDMLAARPVNTTRAYDRAMEQFVTWCSEQGRVPLPATAQTLTEYVGQLCRAALFSPNTIGQAIGAIRSRHAEAGYPGEPDAAEPMKQLAKYRRDWADAGNRVKQRTPILVPDLRKMIVTCDPEALAGLRDRAVLLLGFNIMGRRSEISRINIGDVTSAGDNGVEVYIPYSKTDQDAKGVAVAVPFGQYERTCPVRSYRAWVAALAAQGIMKGPLFRQVDRHGHIGGSDVAAGHVQPRLTGHGVNGIVQRRALLANLRPGDAEDEEAARAEQDEGAPEDDAPTGNYGAHGLRSGAATSAYAAGAPVSKIAEHGRWNPKSPVVLSYIRAADKWRDNPMKGIGL